jgi:hypothetical protein
MYTYLYIYLIFQSFTDPDSYVLLQLFTPDISPPKGSLFISVTNDRPMIQCSNGVGGREVTLGKNFQRNHHNKLPYNKKCWT